MLQEQLSDHGGECFAGTSRMGVVLEGGRWVEVQRSGRLGETQKFLAGIVER